MTKQRPDATTTPSGLRSSSATPAGPPQGSVPVADGTLVSSINPFLPASEYVPDGEPRVFGDRVYVYGSHDLAEAAPVMCSGDYVCYSAPLSDLSKWRYEGVIYRRDQDPFVRAATTRDGMLGMLKSHLFAPDVVEVDGKYYLYYGIGASQSGIAMAVADSPIGPFEYVGRVRYPDSDKPTGWRDGKDGLDDGDMAFQGGQAAISRRGLRFKDYPYDPAVMLHDGRLFLYFGLLNCYVVELDMRDMRTVVKNTAGGYATEIFRAKPRQLIRSKLFGGRKDAHFVNGPSIREVDGRFVLSYYATGDGGFNGLYYAVADKPEGPFAPKGPLVSLGNVRLRGQTAATDHVGNIHGGMFHVDDQWYQIYHRQTRSGRSACAVPLTRTADGGFEHAEHTSMGFSTQPLDAFHRWPAYMACHLTDRKGASGKNAPVIVQRDYDNPEGVLPVVSSLRAGSVVGYKYFDFGTHPASAARVNIQIRPTGLGRVDVVLDDPRSAQPIATIEIDGPIGAWAAYSATLREVSGVHAVYLIARPEGKELGDLSHLAFGRAL